jgi:hypothetical protein
MLSLEKISYSGWHNCYRLSNNKVEIVITSDVGPRIIRFGFVGGENEFYEFEETRGLTGSKSWRSYGGHRLWHAPEFLERTYYPDNEPVDLVEMANFIRLIPPLEKTTGVQKEIDLFLSPEGSHVIITHRLRNCNLWDIELAPWALSVMAPGGIAVVPLPRRGSHDENLFPTNTLTLWAYTDLSDPRWGLNQKYILLKQDETMPDPQKIGVMTDQGWAAYWRKNNLFVKTFERVKGAVYPDFGSSVEIYTDHRILEVETLGPLNRLAPGSFVEHIENWTLFDSIPKPENDTGIEQDILPHIKNFLMGLHLH